jgi:hypothetical protein
MPTRSLGMYFTSLKMDVCTADTAVALFLALCHNRWIDNRLWQSFGANNLLDIKRTSL